MMSNAIKSYIKYLAKSNRRLIIFIWIFLFVMLPFASISRSASNYDVTEVKTSLMIYGVILSISTAIYMFRFLFWKRSADMYFSLPVTRKKLYRINFLFGLASIIIPLLVNYYLSLLAGEWIHGSQQFLNIETILWYPLCIMILFFSLYALTTWISTFTNNLVDSLALSGGYMIVPLIMILTISTFFSSIFYRCMIGSGNYEAQLLPLNWIYKFVSLIYTIGVIYESPSSEMIIMIYWLLLGVVFSYFGYRNFYKRRQEDSESGTVSVFGYPFIICAFTFCMVLLNCTQDVLEERLILFLGIFLMYLIMIFFSQRKIKLKAKHIFIFALITLFSAAISYYSENVMAALVREVPKASEMHSVSFTIENYDMEMIDFSDAAALDGTGYDQQFAVVSIQTSDVNALDMILDLQQQHVTYAKEQETDTSYSGYGYYINYEYTDKNGNLIRRWYYFDQYDNTLENMYLTKLTDIISRSVSKEINANIVTTQTDMLYE